MGLILRSQYEEMQSSQRRFTNLQSSQRQSGQGSNNVEKWKFAFEPMGRTETSQGSQAFIFAAEIMTVSGWGGQRINLQPGQLMTRAMRGQEYGLAMGWLVGFHCIATLLDYFMPNPIYIYYLLTIRLLIIYIYIYD